MHTAECFHLPNLCRENASWHSGSWPTKMKSWAEKGHSPMLASAPSDTTFTIHLPAIPMNPLESTWEPLTLSTSMTVWVRDPSDLTTIRRLIPTTLKSLCPSRAVAPSTPLLEELDDMPLSRTGTKSLVTLEISRVDPSVNCTLPVKHVVASIPWRDEYE